MRDGRIWPTLANVLYNAMRRNLPHVIDHAPELLFPGQVCGFSHRPHSLLVCARTTYNPYGVLSGS